MSRERRRLFLEEEQTAEPGRFGCPMLVRAHCGPLRGSVEPIYRCSLAWALHGEDDVMRCRATQGFALRMGIDPGRWEFQMLYGVRREAQVALAREGYGMRIYVPFGADWYPYFARRIAERPANMLFVLRQLVTR